MSALKVRVAKSPSRRKRKRTATETFLNDLDLGFWELRWTDQHMEILRDGIGP